MLERYISLVEDIYLRKQPDSLSMAYISNYFWEEIGVNESAFEILKRLDGTRTLETLIEDLNKHFSANNIKTPSIVYDFIKELKNKNLLKFHDESHKQSVNIKGSEYYFVPDMMILELTHNCPLKCKHCYANAGIGLNMDINKLIPLLQKLHDLGTSYFQLTGGEPFAYPYIEVVIDFLLENKIRFSITTSGFYWNRRVKRIMDKLKGKGVSIQVSLDGMPETHNKVRGDGKSFNNAVRFLKESIVRNISTSTVTCIFQQSLEEIEELSGFLRDQGVHQHRFGMITNLGRAIDNKISSQVTSEEFYNIIIHLKERFETESFHIGKIEDFEETECQPHTNCGAGYRLYNVTPSLTLSPCTIFKVNIGNLNTEKLETIFTRNTRIFAEMTPPSDSICGSCELLENCQSCFAEGFANKNKVNRCHWYEDEYKNLCVNS